MYLSKDVLEYKRNQVDKEQSTDVLEYKRNQVDVDLESYKEQGTDVLE